MKSGWLLLVPLIAVAALAVACGDDGGGDETSGDTTSPPDMTQAPPATDDEPAEPAAAPVTYEIAAREDVSFGAVVRIVYRVEVSGPLTEEELGRIAQEIIDDETDQQDVNAIGFFFYLPGTDTNSIYTAGVADWAPDGDWAKADTVQSGDYSGHELGAIDIVES